MTRKEKINKLRKQGKTLSVIAKEFHISGERVRQILNSEYCSIHAISYVESCQYCEEEEKYGLFLKSANKEILEKEMVKLSKKDRTAIPSLHRKLLVKKIKKEWNISFSDLARKLHRDRTTISSYFYQ
jgi:hypothetical protein